MRLPLQRRFTIESGLTLDEATVRLSESIGPARTSIFARTREPFKGKLRGRKFDIIRTTYGRNSVRPRIRGTIEPAPNGTRFHGTMKVHEFVLGFFALLLLGPGSFLVSIWLAGLRQGRFDPFLLVFPAGAFLLTFGYSAAFRSESRQALRMLAEIVEAERSGFDQGAAN